jgi:hypothetical protein
MSDEQLSADAFAISEASTEAALIIGNAIKESMNLIADKINPFTAPYSDSEIGGVACVVEGQISTAKGLFAIATAVHDLAAAIREGKEGA